MIKEKSREVSLIGRIDDQLSNLRNHGPDKNHDDCWQCQLVIDLNKIKQALKESEERVRELEEITSPLSIRKILDENTLLKSKLAGVEEIASQFHYWYEKLAPSFGYETRKESAVEWKDVPENNKNLMIAVVDKVINALKTASLPK